MQIAEHHREQFELAYATVWAKDRYGSETPEQLAAEIKSWRIGDTYGEDLPRLRFGWEGYQWARASQCLAQIEEPAGAAPAAVAPRGVTAWMHPETLDVISDAKKHEMSTQYGTETRRKAEGYSVALVRAGEPAAAPALEAPAAPAVPESVREALEFYSQNNCVTVHEADAVEYRKSEDWEFGSYARDNQETHVVSTYRARYALADLLAAAPQAPAAAWTMPVMQVRPLETAPKDGTIVQLLVQFVDHPPGQKSVLNGAGPLYDTADPCWTIGGNTVENTGVDHWQFVGWNWEQDCFVDTSTDSGHRVLGWTPFDVAAPAAPAVDVLDADRWRALEGQMDAGRVSLTVHHTEAEQWDGRTISDAGELQDYADSIAAQAKEGGEAC